MGYHGSMNGESFEAWLKTCLLKSIEKESVIIMDNVSFHRKKELEKNIQRSKSRIVVSASVFS